jgi:hypothetical protein
MGSDSVDRCGQVNAGALEVRSSTVRQWWVANVKPGRVMFEMSYLHTADAAAASVAGFANMPPLGERSGTLSAAVGASIREIIDTRAVQHEENKAVDAGEVFGLHRAVGHASALAPRDITAT